MNKKIFKYAYYRTVKKKNTYVAISIIIISAFFTLKRNWILYSLYLLDHVGAINMFIYSSIKGNGIMSLLAPFVIMLVYPTIFYEDLQNKVKRNVRRQMTKTDYFLSEIVSAFVVSGSIYMIGNVIVLVIGWFVSPYASCRITFLVGIFSDIYMDSMGKYILLFVAHAFLFGGVYGIFGIGIVFFIKNKCLLWIVPTLLYYTGYYVVTFFEKGQELLKYVIPLLTYEISTFDIPLKVNIMQMISVGLTGCILFYIGLSKADI